MEHQINVELEEVLKLEDTIKDSRLHVSGQFLASMKNEKVVIVVDYEANSKLDVSDIEYTKITAVLDEQDNQAPVVIELNNDDLQAVQSIIYTEVLFAANNIEDKE